mgnify:FL=1
MAENKTQAPLLTEIEKHSAVWQKIMKHLEERLSSLRARNDNDLDERRTARLRGRLAEIKHLLALDQPRPQTDADDS